jgi:Spy/CpxP family protein refolding chaperone
MRTNELLAQNQLGQNQGEGNRMSLLPRARTLLGLALVAALTLPLAAQAGRGFGGRGHDRPMAPGRMIEKHAERLGLSEATLASIDEIVKTSRAGSEELREELQAAHRDMRDLLMQDEPSEPDVMAQAALISDVELELKQSRLRAMLHIRGLLTPEQRDELRKIREENQESAFVEVRKACDADAQALCPDAAEGPERMRCMRESREQLSDECRGALRSLRHRGSKGRFGGPTQPECEQPQGR